MKILLFIVAMTAMGQNEIKKETDTRKKIKWTKVSPMLTKMVNTYGVTECCGVHRSEPRK